MLGVRHGHLRVLPESADSGQPARVYTVEPTGDITCVRVWLGDGLVVASMPGVFRVDTDQPIRLEFDQEHLYLFDGETRQALQPAATAILAAV